MFRTVQAKFTAAILCVVALFLLAFLLVNYNLLRSHSLSGAQDTAELIRNGADDRLNQVFREVEYLTRSLAEYRVVQEADVEAMRELFISTVLIRQSYIRAIYLGTEEGEMHEWGVGEGFVDHTPTFPPGYDPRKRKLGPGRRGPGQGAVEPAGRLRIVQRSTELQTPAVLRGRRIDETGCVELQDHRDME